MIDITNKLFQPLTYQLVDGSGLHLPLRGHAVIPERQISDELRRAVRRGLISLQTQTAPEVLLETPSAAKPSKKKEG